MSLPVMCVLFNRICTNDATNCRKWKVPGGVEGDKNVWIEGHSVLYQAHGGASYACLVRISSDDVDDPSANSVLHDQPVAYHPGVKHGR